MPWTSLVALAVVSAAALAHAEPAAAQRADYQAAFDDDAPQAGWPSDAAADRGAPRAARLPIKFQGSERRIQDRQLRPAVAFEAEAPGRLPAPDRAIRLAPPQDESQRTALRLPTASIQTVAGGLGAAVGLFLVVAWIMRRGLPKGSGVLPREVVELLGRAPLSGRQQLHLLRLGNKLVLVSISQTGVESLSEVTDPLEVDRLTGLCYQTHPQGATANFRHVLQSFEAPRTGYGSTRVVDRLDLTQLDAIAQGSRGKETGHVR